MDYPRKSNASCNVCNKLIYRRASQLKKNNGNAYCSSACYGKSRRIEQPCIVCRALIGSRFKKKTCSRECANKNRAGMKYKLSLPRKDKVADARRLKVRLLEIRGQGCEKCGYNKVEVLEVHHKDRNRGNNELDNLELICPNCHSEQHYLEKSWLKGII